MTPASPWDALLKAPAPQPPAPRETLAREHPAATRTAELLRLLAELGPIPTLSLAVAADLEPRQVWGLLKTPRAIGQVVFDAGRWALVDGFSTPELERAAALLRRHGWHVEPPDDAADAASPL